MTAVTVIIEHLSEATWTNISIKTYIHEGTMYMCPHCKQELTSNANMSKHLKVKHDTIYKDCIAKHGCNHIIPLCIRTHHLSLLLKLYLFI